MNHQLLARKLYEVVNVIEGMKRSNTRLGYRVTGDLNIEISTKIRNFGMQSVVFIMDDSYYVPTFDLVTRSYIHEEIASVITAGIMAESVDAAVYAAFKMASDCITHTTSSKEGLYDHEASVYEDKMQLFNEIINPAVYRQQNGLIIYKSYKLQG